MLKALGINMYTTLGKCLVEFVANAYDANARHVEISIPFAEIDAARAKIKAELAAERATHLATSAEEGEKPSAQPDLTAFLKTIDESIAIVITDDGHGMSPGDVSSKFLPLNRQRRLDVNGKETTLQSEGNRRHVMGRKGLGKLAGFGTAQKVEIRTKRKDQDFRTTFVMDSSDLMGAKNLADKEIPATYEEGLPVASCGTTVILRGLKPDAVKSNQDKIVATLAQAFYGIDPADFAITLNGEPVKPPVIDYEYTYPEGLAEGTMADTEVDVPDIGRIQLQYVVRFRRRGQHLSAGLRGARIYCNHRLAAGPSLLKLGTGMHNFHGVDYLECIVAADQLDRLGIDFVNTNRTQLREDNDVVDLLQTHITQLMKEALAKHATFREGQAEIEIATTEEGARATRMVQALSTKTRAPAAKLLKSFAARFGANSPEFNELAPLVVQSVNTGEVLIRLIDLQADPKTISHVADELRDLAEIEKSDSLKVFRGRVSAIIALQTLVDQGDELWKKNQNEAALHNLLKRSPWLIRPEFNNYLTSDENLTKLSSKIAKVLGIDNFAPIRDGRKQDLQRPDLVFALGSEQSHFVVVELKSPSLPLDITHLDQLQEYMFKVEQFIKSEFSGRITPRVTGHLIGAMPKIGEKHTVQQARLMDAASKVGPNTPYEVIGLVDLFERTKSVHQFLVHQIRDELEEDGSAFAPAPIPVGKAKAVSLPVAAAKVVSV